MRDDGSRETSPTKGNKTPSRKLSPPKHLEAPIVEVTENDSSEENREQQNIPDQAGIVPGASEKGETSGARPRVAGLPGDRTNSSCCGDHAIFGVAEHLRPVDIEAVVRLLMRWGRACNDPCREVLEAPARLKASRQGLSVREGNAARSCERQGGGTGGSH